MTYRELLSKLQSFTDNQLDNEILVYNYGEDVFFDDGTELCISVNEVPGFISKDFPYLVV